MKCWPILLFFVWQNAFAVMDLPRRLNEEERLTALEIFGFGTASKLLSNPYPMGGHEGFEFGLTSEYIPVQDISGLGSKTSTHTEYNYHSLTFGKGFFYNIDALIHFTPFPQPEDFSNYGGQIRWGFYDFKFIPGGLSLILHRSESNFASLIITKTTGYDLVATVNLEDVVLYFGMGQARSTGVFMGGDPLTAYKGITDNGETIEHEKERFHTLFGLSLSFDKLFFGIEINRFVVSSYAAKLGYRF